MLLGLDHREQRPLDDVEPLVVAVAHHRPERLLRDDLGQDHVVGRVLGARPAHRHEARHVGGVDVAAAGEVGVGHLLELLDHHRLERHVVGAEVVGQVELGGGAGLHADGGAVELLGAFHVQLLRHHEALAVVVVHAGEIEAEAGVARQRPGGVARQDVDLARLQRGEALLRGERREAHLRRVAEHGGRDGAADVDVEPLPLALRIGLREAGQAGVDAALHEALGLHCVQGRLRLRGQRRKRDRKHALLPRLPSSRSSSGLMGRSTAGDFKPPAGALQRAIGCSPPSARAVATPSAVATSARTGAQRVHHPLAIRPARRG